MNSAFKLLIIDSHPVQYRVPIYRQLASLLASEGQRLHVIYGSDSSVRGAMDSGFGQTVIWDEPMLEGYDNEFLPGAEQASPGSLRSISGSGIEARIRDLKPDAIFLNGINYELYVRALITARLQRIPIWLRSETQDYAFARSRLKSVIREGVYRLAYSQISHFFPIGELNARHYRDHGVRDSQMTFCRYCVVDRFQAPPDQLNARRVAKRDALGIPLKSTVVMFSGKLIEKKNPAVLIEAWQRLPKTSQSEFTLLFVGSGEQQEELMAHAKACGATTVFAGFVNQSEIADYYLASDAVILPSRQMGETWGLVANEALMAGKPVILSKNAGSSVDFEHFPGVQVVDPTPEIVAQAFLKLDQMPSGEVMRSTMHDYTIEAAASAIQKHCRRI